MNFQEQGGTRGRMLSYKVTDASTYAYLCLFF